MAQTTDRQTTRRWIWLVATLLLLGIAANQWFLGIVGARYFFQPSNRYFILLIVSCVASYILTRKAVQKIDTAKLATFRPSIVALTSLAAGIFSATQVSELSPRLPLGIAYGLSFAIIPWLALLPTQPKPTRQSLFVAIGSLLALLCTLTLFRGGLFDGSSRYRLEVHPTLARWFDPIPTSNQANIDRVLIDKPWLGFRGSDRTGVAFVPESTSLHPSSLKKLWSQPLGDGWGSFAIAGDRAITLETIGDREYLTAFDLESGKKVWSQEIGAAYENEVSQRGSRSTPTLDGEQTVYAHTANGDLAAVDFHSGKLLWSCNTLELSRSENRLHGVCGSPWLNQAELIIFGGHQPDWALMGIDCQTGNVRWHAGTQAPSYSSPQVVTLNGIEVILALGADEFVGYALSDHRVLWRHPFSNSSQTLCSQPIVVPSSAGARIILTGGYGSGAECLELTPSQTEATWQVKSLWKNQNLQTKFTCGLLIDSNLFGLDNGILQCVSTETGKELFKSGRYGHGQMIQAGKHLLIQCENGDLAVVQTSSDKRREVARFPALDAMTWNHPALAYPYLLIRNNQQAICWRME